MRIEFTSSTGIPLILDADIIHQKKDGTAIAYGELFFTMAGEMVSLGSANIDILVDIIKAHQPTTEQSTK